MPRKAILHIGPMKTGSSSIQVWLSRSAATLAESGIYVPRSFGPNMSRLATIAEAFTVGVDPTPGDQERLKGFKAELDELDSSITTIVVSGEMLGHQLRKPEQLRYLRELLSPYASEFSIFVYLRRQDEISLSRYSTALRRGERRARPLSTVFDYEKLLDLWSGEFGKETIHPRLYDRSSLIGGDVVRDFAEAAGLPFDQDGKKPISQNTSLQPVAQSFLAALAAKVRDSGFEQPFEAIAGHAAINRLLSTAYQGTGYQPSREDVLRFYGQIADSNERVRARWFPERGSLFSEDFSKYSETAPALPSSDELLAVALEVITTLVTAPAALEVGPRAGGQTAQRALDERLRRERRDKRMGMRRRGRRADAE